MPVIGITPQCFLDLQGKAVHPTAHVGVARGQPHPHPARQRDHRLTSPRSAALTTAGSAAPEIRTRPPSGISISISPKGAGTASATDGAAGAIATAAKPGILAAGTPRPISGPYRLRQA